MITAAIIVVAVVVVVVVVVIVTVVDIVGVVNFFRQFESKGLANQLQLRHFVVAGKERLALEHLGKHASHGPHVD